MNEPLNCYHVLGLSPPVTTEQVRTSYVRLLKQLHPDRVLTGPPLLRLQQIQRAYRTLHDARQRADYDSALVKQERAHRQGMRRARSRIRRMGASAPPARPTQRSPWPRRLMILASFIIILLIASRMLKPYFAP